MEIVLFLAMMIVPFVSIAALIISVLTVKRVDALKRLTLKIVDRKPEQQRRSLLDEYAVDEV